MAKKSAKSSPKRTSVKKAAKKSPAKQRTAKAAAAELTLAERVLNVRPDVTDFRDRMFEPTLVEVPQERLLTDYQKFRVPILDQGREGACTGFGLATVSHFLLRTRVVHPDKEAVSPRMLYDMARRYDEFEGDDTEGSSARGAMKGWHKHGVCSEQAWPYVEGAPNESLNGKRATDAARRPLGAYLRVNHKDLTAMHCAITEVGVLYATGMVHTGWDDIDSTDGLIVYDGTQSIRGGHAFALVAYDRDGFWLQNSWGPTWGKGGFAKIKYSDWLVHGTDVWVARLGVPVNLDHGRATAAVNADSASSSTAAAFHSIRPHIISIGNNGLLQTRGTYATSEADVTQIVNVEAQQKLSVWEHPQLLLYAHGGLTPETSAVQRIADYAQPLLKEQIYPIMFSWKSDYWATIRNILEDSLRRRSSGGVIEAAKNFLLDRLDDALEPVARQLSGKAVWDEMKQNATQATVVPKGGARLALQAVVKLKKAIPKLEIHVAGHSAGAIFDAYLLQLLCTTGPITDGLLAGGDGLGLTVKTCTLWAPACTADLFVKTYGVCLRQGRIGKLRLFTLTDGVERDDDVAKIYNKSLLYLVAHAFEDTPRIPVVREFGVPIAGMAQCFEVDPRSFSQQRDQDAVREMQALRKEGFLEWVQAPNSHAPESGKASTAVHHGDFDDDPPTLMSLLATLKGPAVSGAAPATAAWTVGGVTTQPGISFQVSARACNTRRQQLEGILS
ncbi:MAG TPA: C1 family peptidase [Planctomycetaceae bacterium]|nr:C1 family peptidase [Planctomycetaceae bacterium]